MFERRGVYTRGANIITTAQFIAAMKSQGWEVQLFKSWAQMKHYNGKYLDLIEIIGIDPSAKDLDKLRRSIETQDSNVFRKLLKQGSFKQCTINVHNDFDFEEHLRGEEDEETLAETKRKMKRDVYKYIQGATVYYELGNSSADTLLLESAARTLHELTGGLVLDEDTDQCLLMPKDKDNATQAGKHRSKKSIEPKEGLKFSKEQVAELRDILVSAGYLSSTTSFRIKKSSDITSLLLQSDRKKMLTYDMECIENDRDYACLLEEHLAATGCDLVLKELVSVLDGGKSIIEFMYQGKHYRWEFNQLSDWVAAEFQEHVLDFVAQHTPGELVFLPSLDQSVGLVYLDKASAEHFRDIIGGGSHS